MPKIDQDKCQHKNTSIVVPAANKVICNDCGAAWSIESQRAPRVKKGEKAASRGAVLDPKLRAAPKPKPK